MTIISIETRKELVKSTTSILSLKKGVKRTRTTTSTIQQDTSTDTVTVTKDSLVLTQGRTNHLVLDQLRAFLIMTHPPPGHVQQLTTQMACLDAFSHVVECIFLLQQDNVIRQALLDLWGDSGNPCTIYVLLMVPLDTLTITYGRTSDA